MSARRRARPGFVSATVGGVTARGEPLGDFEGRVLRVATNVVAFPGRRARAMPVNLLAQIHPEQKRAAAAAKKSTFSKKSKSSIEKVTSKLLVATATSEAGREISASASAPAWTVALSLSRKARPSESSAARARRQNRTCEIIEIKWLRLAG